MDYITLYNLKFDIQKQIVSIEYNNHQYNMKINQNVQTQFIPVILSNPIHIPSKSNCFAKVSIPISYIFSRFISHYKFLQHDPLLASHKFLPFHNHFSRITLSNTSFNSQFIHRGTCVGYLCRYTIAQYDNKASSHLINSSGAAKGGESPVTHDLTDDKISYNHMTNPISCATINRIHTSTEKDLRELTSQIISKQ